MSSLSYARFKNEKELLKAILNSLSYAEVYPRVTAIGGGKIIPDIDILQIDRISHNQYRLTGLEIKLVKFDKKSKGLSWSSFYSGIGQALLSLKNGVHRVGLVLGFHESIGDDKMVEEFKSWLWSNRELLRSILGGYISIGLYLYLRGGIYTPVEATSDFYTSDESIRLLSEELMQKKFTFDKKLKS
ncbi:MAG: hypothetical protein QXR82_06300 [Candidatus Bathyarchaeia archaeon]